MSRARPLAARDRDARELMDDPDCDPHALERTYARFRLVNAIVAAQGSGYRRWIRPRLRGTASPRLLDIGTGGADFPRRVLRWAERDDVTLEVLAVDLDPRAIRFAASREPVAGLQLRQADTAALLAAGEHFAAVTSNHLLHHLDDAELVALLDDSARLLAPGGVAVHSDIERSRWGYVAFAAGTAVFQPTLLRDTFIRADGLTSIRRSRTAAELSAIVPEGWRVRRAFPSRVEVVLEAS